MADPRASFHAAALRWKKNDLDLLRRNLATLQSSAATLARQRDTVMANLAAETDVAAQSGDRVLRFDLFAAAQRQTLADLAAQEAQLESRIETARAQVSTAFEVVKPLERTADAHAAQRRAAQAAADQAALDDRTAALHGRGEN